MVAMAADIAIRCATLNPQLKENAAQETPGVVLIDEVDLHLHPRWQRRVVNELLRAFPKIQFLSTNTEENQKVFQLIQEMWKTTVLVDNKAGAISRFGLTRR